MKTIYKLLFIAVLFISQSAFAQNDCSTPYQLNGYGQTFSVITGTPNTDTTNDYGCLATTSNVTWLYFQVCTPGNLDLIISTSSGSGLDIDFVAWGPLTSPSVCGLDSTQVFDCGVSTGTFGNVDITSALTGEFYKIMISNFSNAPGSFTISLAAGPGSICDSIDCPGAPAPQEICQVSTDPLLNHNIIIWEKDSAYSGDYLIQKETTTMGTYTTIATVMNADTSVYEDVSSNPMIQSFKYRIAISDTCGNIITGYDHWTIHLLTSVAMGTGFPQLSWNQYIGFNYYTYYIYRGTSAATLSLYDSISASFNTYTDVSPVSGTSFYAVAVFPPAACQPSRAMNIRSLSNVAPVIYAGIGENELSAIVISPNPANDQLLLDLGKPYLSLQAEICDITGRRLFYERLENASSARFDVSSIAPGYYFLKLTDGTKISLQKIIIAR